MCMPLVFLRACLSPSYVHASYLQVLKRERRPDRSEAELFAAVRKEMDRRIFDELIP